MFLEKSYQQTYPPPHSNNRLDDPQKSQAMSTEFAMPVQQFTASPTHSQYTLYNNQSQQSSPTATPKGSSPTSPQSVAHPHLPAHTRQLRPPKSPLYVPAVLRPTDPPRTRKARQSPLTPPDSNSNSNSFENLEDARTLSRRSTGDSAKFGLGEIVETEYSIEGLGKVTALPTKTHWKVR